MENIRKESQPDNETDHVFDIYELNMRKMRFSVEFISFLFVSM